MNNLSAWRNKTPIESVSNPTFAAISSAGSNPAALTILPPSFRHPVLRGAAIGFSYDGGFSFSLARAGEVERKGRVTLRKHTDVLATNGSLLDTTGAANQPGWKSQIRSMLFPAAWLARTLPAVMLVNVVATGYVAGNSLLSPRN